MGFDALIKPELWLYKVIELKMEYHQIIHIFTSEGNSFKVFAAIEATLPDVCFVFLLMA